MEAYCATALLTDTVSGNHAAFAPQEGPGITVVPLHRRTKEGWLERNFVVTITLSAHSPQLAAHELQYLLQAYLVPGAFRMTRLEAKPIEIANEPQVGVTLMPRILHPTTIDQPNV